MKSLSFFFFLLLTTSYTISQNNLSLLGRISSSDGQEANARAAIDGDTETYWLGDSEDETKWLFVVLPGAAEMKKLKVYMEDAQRQAIHSFAIQTYKNGNWEIQNEQSDNNQKEITIEFEKTILNDRLRLVLFSEAAVKVREIEVYGEAYISDDATPIKKILVNQSGYNLGKSKRFTAPYTPDNTPFLIQNTRTPKVEFQGKVQSNVGDFSQFNPQSSDEFVIKIDTITSHPFRVGPYWLERVTYQNMIDFMIGARHYVGTTDQIRQLSFAWRDGDFFNWALQGLIAQYLSNPEAYNRLEKKITYVDNSSLPAAYQGKWGKLERYSKDAPDIVKLIHWDVDVKISQGLEHEMQKAELAHFLYAYPYLKEWLPRQNFDVVYNYLKAKWTKADVSKASTSQYDKSPEHNLLALKTKLGTAKGELPPGHSIIPNLMMYEVTKKQNEADAEKYFNAAFKQMEWMIAKLDWNDPMTTKGQRVSEHISMRAFAYFYHQYPERYPKGLYEKVEEWVKVAISRSKNIWDFRKFTDKEDWVKAGWNETGNVLGFPAAAIAAKSVLQDAALNQELERLIWSHFDNSFGRNPTGRHFSYDGPKEIEGVDLGWYSTYKGGIGLLEPVRFVFDGSPKTNHYPNHPEVGNIGWTEGWVQFNTAFNTSMAYLAHNETAIELIKLDKKTIRVRLKAPLNFDENKVDQVKVVLKNSNGETIDLVLTEEGKYSKFLSGSLRLKKGYLKNSRQKLKVNNGDEISVSYGLGYFERKAEMVVN